MMMERVPARWAQRIQRMRRPSDVIGDGEAAAGHRDVDEIAKRNTGIGGNFSAFSLASWIASWRASATAASDPRHQN